MALFVAVTVLLRLTDGRPGLDRVSEVLAFIVCAIVAAGVVLLVVLVLLVELPVSRRAEPVWEAALDAGSCPQQ